MSKKYRYRSEVAKQDGVKVTDADQDGTPESLEVEGVTETFVAEKPYTEGGERPKGYELVDDEAQAQESSQSPQPPQTPPSQQTPEAPKAQQGSESAKEEKEEEKQAVTPPPASKEGHSSEQASSQEGKEASPPPAQQTPSSESQSQSESEKAQSQQSEGSAQSEGGASKEQSGGEKAQETEKSPGSESVQQSGQPSHSQSVQPPAQPQTPPAPPSQSEQSQQPPSPPPAQPQPSESEHQAPSESRQEGGRQEGGVGVVDTSPERKETPDEPRVEEEVGLTPAQSFAKSIKERFDTYVKNMGPNVTQTEASLVRNQVSLFYIFQLVLQVPEYENFEAGVQAIYKGFVENHALCFSHNARFRGIMNIPVSQLEEAQVEVLTALIDLFCRLAEARNLTDLRGTYNFKTLTDNIYDQFVLSRFLGFIKKVIGEE